MNGSNEVAQLLAQLAGLAEPEPIGWWPPAWGWWVVALVAVVLVYGALRLVQHWRQRSQWRSAALSELSVLERRAATGGDRLALLSDVSILLRRVALLHLGRARVARLHGQAWLDTLDRLSGSNAFSHGPGVCLVEAPYRSVAPAEDEFRATMALTRQLIERLSNPARVEKPNDGPGTGRHD